MANKWVCELCWPGTVEVHEVMPGHMLVQTPDGLLRVIGGQGHKDDDWITFTEPPAVDPDPLGEDESVPYQLSEAWRKKAMAAMSHSKVKEFDLRGQYLFVRELIEAGYRPVSVGEEDNDGYAELWLYDRIAHALMDSHVSL